MDLDSKLSGNDKLSHSSRESAPISSNLVVHSGFSWESDINSKDFVCNPAISHLTTKKQINYC